MRRLDHELRIVGRIKRVRLARQNFKEDIICFSGSRVGIHPVRGAVRHARERFIFRSVARVQMAVNENSARSDCVAEEPHGVAAVVVEREVRIPFAIDHKIPKRRNGGTSGICI